MFTIILTTGGNKLSFMLRVRGLGIVQPQAII